MFCRYILAPLAALLLVPALLSPAAAQGPGDWDRGGRDNDQRDWDRGGRDNGQRDGDRAGPRDKDQSEWVGTAGIDARRRHRRRPRRDRRRAA